jgi:glutamyl/glutaminyl-tRNA synthetase
MVGMIQNAYNFWLKRLYINAIRKFCESIGVAKRENIIDYSLLEFCLRDDLNKAAARVMAVLDPVKLLLLIILLERRRTT